MIGPYWKIFSTPRKPSVVCSNGLELYFWRQASVATRAISREVGCTTGTASKWRVRITNHSFKGLSETGDRGAVPKYTTQTDKRILAQLDTPPTDGYNRFN